VAASKLHLVRSIKDLTGHTRRTYRAFRKTVHAVRRARESTGRNIPSREQVEGHLAMAERHSARTAIEIKNQQHRIAFTNRCS
jgi:hypothetical protein